MLAVAPGCKGKSVENPILKSPSIVSGTAKGEDEQKALAMMVPVGQGANETEISGWQEKAKSQPEKSDVWVGLAEAWIKRARQKGDPGDYTSADAAASLAAARGATAAAQGLQALVMLNHHQFKQALELAQKNLAKDPNDLRTLGVVADAQLEIGQYDESAATVQKMLDLKPNLPSYGRSSYLRWVNGDVEVALKQVKSALDAGQDPRDREPRAWTLCQAATYFWQQGDFEGAITGFDQALSLIPGYAPALQGKGKALLSKGDAAHAADALGESFHARPLVETGIFWIEALQASNDPALAEAVKATEEEGKRGDGYGLGLFWAMRREHSAEAIAALEKEKENRPGLYVLDGLGWAYFRAGRLADAERESSAAVARGTPDARLWFHRGMILAAQGKQDEGKAAIEKALKLNPNWIPSEVAEAKQALAGAGAGKP